jgi:nitric oxide reductase subunit B
MQQPLLQNLRWMRVVGDVIFTFGVAALVYFVAGLKLGWSIRREAVREAPSSPALGGGLRPAPAMSPEPADR